MRNTQYKLLTGWLMLSSDVLEFIPKYQKKLYFGFNQSPKLIKKVMKQTDCFYRKGSKHWALTEGTL